LHSDKSYNKTASSASGLRVEAVLLMVVNLTDPLTTTTANGQTCALLPSYKVNVPAPAYLTYTSKKE
jgi:hypothetical protein